MRKLTAVFFAVESLWIGLWLGIWEFYPVRPWPNEWWRPVVITSAAIMIMTIVIVYLLADSVEVEEAEVGEPHGTTREHLHTAREFFLQLFAFFLAVEATFKILNYLHVETESNSTLAFIQHAVDVGSVVGTVGLIIHFFRSIYEARYIIVGLITFAFLYVVLQSALEAGAKIGEIKLKTIQQGLDSGACHYQFDIKKGEVVQCAFPVELKPLR